MQKGINIPKPRVIVTRAILPKGFDMHILYHDPSIPPEPGSSAQAVDLETLLREADFISVHTLLNPQTYHLIDARAFSLMKPSAVLVNTARGGVVDPQALYDALHLRRIAAAALDVPEPEPIPLDSPLLTLDNLVIAPHIASASLHTREKMSLMAAENLVAGVIGQRLPNCVNPDVYLNRIDF